MWSRLAVGPLGPMLLGAMAAMACGSALMLGTMGAQAQASNCEAVVMQFLLIISSYKIKLSTVRFPVDCRTGFAEAFLNSAENLFWFVFRSFGRKTIERFFVPVLPMDVI